MPDRGRSLTKYEDKFFTQGIGQVSFSAHFHDLSAGMKDLVEEVAGIVWESAQMVAARARAKAPNRSGDLRRGIIANPEAERSSNPHKVVHDVVIDAGMNDTFVKMSKAGKRYYYPASQEYGFKIRGSRRVPGRYYMRDAGAEFYAEHTRRVAAGVQKRLEDL